MNVREGSSVPPPLPGLRTSRRRSLRRAVQVECQVLSDFWDEQVPVLATNLSSEGLWLQSPLPLERGSELLVTLLPPRWIAEQPLVTLARVERVGMFRRRSEAQGSGMGLAFVDMEASEHDALLACLRGLPPPLPSPARRARVLHASTQTELCKMPSECELSIDDGTSIRLCAESGLLTAGRPLRGNAATRVQLVPTEPVPARVRRRHRRRNAQAARPRLTLRRPRLALVPDLAS